MSYEPYDIDLIDWDLDQDSTEQEPLLVLEPCSHCNGSGLVNKSVPQRFDFKILRSHSSEELEVDVARALNDGWTLCGNLHTLGFVDGTIEYMWGVKREIKEGGK